MSVAVSTDNNTENLHLEKRAGPMISSLLFLLSARTERPEDPTMGPEQTRAPQSL